MCEVASPMSAAIRFARVVLPALEFPATRRRRGLCDKGVLRLSMGTKSVSQTRPVALKRSDGGFCWQAASAHHHVKKREVHERSALSRSSSQAFLNALLWNYLKR